MMFCYMKPGEAPNPKTILARLNESDKCVLTGSKEKVEYLPVDFNVSNILPSNMAGLCEDKVKEVSESFTFTYNARLWGYDLTFESTQPFERYDRKILGELQASTDSSKFESSKLEAPRLELLPKLFEYLTGKHIKGLAQISNQNSSIDCMQYQNYLMRLLVKAEKEASQE